ncbi:hypothetical protein SLE2022_053740 [Rubroshorea leprosula]
MFSVLYLLMIATFFSNSALPLADSCSNGIFLGLPLFFGTGSVTTSTLGCSVAAVASVASPIEGCSDASVVASIEGYSVTRVASIEGYSVTGVASLTEGCSIDSTDAVVNFLATPLAFVGVGFLATCFTLVGVEEVAAVDLVRVDEVAAVDLAFLFFLKAIALCKCFKYSLSSVPTGLPKSSSLRDSYSESNSLCELSKLSSWRPYLFVVTLPRQLQVVL